MICAQLVAYGQVSQRRVERQERKKKKETSKIDALQRKNGYLDHPSTNGNAVNGSAGHMNGTGKEHLGNGRLESIREDEQSDPGTEDTDSEVVL